MIQMLTYVLLLLVLLLSASAAGAQDCLLADDFDLGNTGLWTVTNPQVVTFDQGMLRIDFTGPGDHSEWGILDPCVYGDFELTVDARSNAPTPSKIVVFHTAGPTTDFDGYGLNVRAAPFNDVVLIRRNAPFTNFRLADASLASAIGQWVQIKIRMEGARIQVWVDGAPMIDVVDPEPLGPGWTGLAIHGGAEGVGRVDFDNFAIEPIGGAVATATSSWGRVKSLY